eukprot:2830896-Pleurochrysis_carterae.AAC.1
MADLLSIERDVGSAVVSPRSWKSERKYTASFVASDAAMICASHEESATEGCFLDAHEMAA